jgi:type VI secretion system protein ImpA
MFSIDKLLHPVSGGQACGEDLSFSSELDAIAKARIQDDPTLDQGEWVVALKEADWPFVAARCAQLIESKSKDLRLAVWLAEAHAKTRHFRGLGDGYALLAGLCEQYWDGLYPMADEGEYEQRIGNLFWLLTRSPQLICEIPLTEGAGTAYSMADFEAARQRAASAGAPPEQNWGAAPADPGPTMAQLDAARQGNSARFNDTLLADAKYCLDALNELERAVDARLGADGPGFRAAREALGKVIHFIAPLATQEKDGGNAAEAVDAAAGAPAGAARADVIAGPIQNRTQALAQLRLVAEFFRRTEPHSPVAYLADKAADWGEMPLHLWLRSVVKDTAAIAMLEELLGSAAKGDPAG